MPNIGMTIYAVEFYDTIAASYGLLVYEDPHRAFQIASNLEKGIARVWDNTGHLDSSIYVSELIAPGHFIEIPSELADLRTHDGIYSRYMDDAIDPNLIICVINGDDVPNI